MLHARAMIRAEFVERLTGLETTQDRVYAGRTRPLSAGHAPTLLIYTVEESSAPGTFDGNAGALSRTLQVMVDGRVSAETPPDDLLDQVALEVEDRLRADRTLGGLAFDLVLHGTITDVKAEGVSHLGVIRLEYRVRYSLPADDLDD